MHPIKNLTIKNLWFRLITLYKKHKLFRFKDFKCM